MRGTTDATEGDVAPTGMPVAPQTDPLASGDQPALAPPKFSLPKLRSTAIPERYPVALPALVAYPRSVRPRGGAFDANVDPVPAPAPSTAALPAPSRRTIRPDENPFGPVGYGEGNVRLFPYVEQSFGYDSNPEQVSTGVKGSAYSRTEAGLTLQSDWSSHLLTAALHGGYDEFFDNPRADRPDANGVIDFRLDVTRDTKIDTEFRFNVDTQRPGSPELDVAVRDRPLVESVGGTFGVTQGLGRFSVGLHGLIDRNTYEDGELTNGDKVNLSYQDYTDYGFKAKIGYDLKPGLQPFVEIGIDRRIHDDAIDPGGYRRDSDGIGGRAGASFEFWPQLTGTASLGYASRHYDDGRLKDLTGPTADASLAWAVTPLTTVTINGSTAFNETTVIGASGIESRAFGIAVSHALYRYLTLTAAVAYQNDQYIGASITENTWTESLKAEYHLTRSLVLTGTFLHQRLNSTSQGSSYDQDVALVGLKLQH